MADGDEVQDPGLAKPYGIMLDGIVSGNRFTDPGWPEWFYATEGPFEERVRQVFTERGIVPGEQQYELVRAELLSPPPPPPEEPAPEEATRKGAKK